MSNKLRNIEAVNKILRGDHKSQTRKTFYFGNAKHKATTVIKVLEEDDSGNPKKWIEEDNKTKKQYTVTQHNGHKTKVPVRTWRDDIRDSLRAPDNCPKCKNSMNDHERRLHMKFYFTRGHCFSCQLAEESLIRLKGKDAWDKYQKEYMLRQAEGWFKDADAEVEELKESFKKRLWENADGRYGEFSIEDIVKQIDEEYQKLKTRVREQLDHEELKDQINTPSKDLNEKFS